MSTKQVMICTAGECNGECYRCRMKALQTQRDDLLAALKASKATLEAIMDSVKTDTIDTIICNLQGSASVIFQIDAAIRRAAGGTI